MRGLQLLIANSVARKENRLSQSKSDPEQKDASEPAEEELDEVEQSVQDALNNMLRAALGMPIPMVKFPQGYTVHEKMIAKMHASLVVTSAIATFLLHNCDDGLKKQFVKMLGESTAQMEQQNQERATNIVLPGAGDVLSKAIKDLKH